MSAWPDIFSRFRNLNVLIVGDVMADAYIWGVVERISPEAPVPVVSVRKRDFRLGGAGNVALNILALGAKPILCALTGKDDHGKRLFKLMEERNMSTDGLVDVEGRPTTVKTRVIAAHQHVVRVDDESDRQADEKEETAMLTRISRLAEKADVIVFEDYDKGVITPRVIAETVNLASKRGIPTVVDPKKRNFLHYKGVTLFKPNLKELREGLKVEVDAANMKSIDDAVNLVRNTLTAQGVMLTLSEHGVYIDFKGEKVGLPAHKREIADVSGAGDTVVSIASLCVALGLSARQVAGLSNLGGGLVCQHVGVVPIDRDELLREASAVL